MKTIFSINFCQPILLLATLLFAVPLAAEETVYFKDGSFLKGEVLRVDRGRLRLRTSMGGGTAETAHDLDRIQKIVWKEQFSPSQQSIMSDHAARLKYLETLFDQKKVFLSVPESDAGEVGLAVVEELLSAKRFSDAQKFLDTLENDWCAKRRQKAISLKTQCLAGAGHFKEALALASDFEKTAKDASSLALVHLALGEASAGSGKTEKALEHFLFARVFYPSLVEPSSEGLWKASQIFMAQTNTVAAARALHDLTEDYPSSRFAGQARLKLNEMGSVEEKNYVTQAGDVAASQSQAQAAQEPESASEKTVSQSKSPETKTIKETGKKKKKKKGTRNENNP